MQKKALRIYIASSWKNQKAVLEMADILEGSGFEVDAFCRPGTRYVFYWAELVNNESDLDKYDAITFLNDPRVQRAFNEDKKWLDWADCVVMMKPCGNSAHLEAGYAKGRGKRVYIYGDFPLGEFDVMYRFADGLFRTEEMHKLIKQLEHDSEFHNESTFIKNK